MQVSIACRSCRTATLYRGPARRVLPILRPIASAGSSSTPEPGPEVNEHGKVSEEKPPHTETAATIDLESTTVADAPADKTEPSSSTSGEKDEGRVEPAVASTTTAVTAHPLEDVPEEEEEDIIASKELVAEVMDGAAFGKRGEQWLFAQVVAIGMLLFPPLTLKGLMDFGATLALTTGLVFIITAFFNLGRNISPLPEPRKKHQLVVSGIYGYVRHPMYGGLLLAGLGLAVLTRNETRLAILALLWWILENKVAVEEKALSARYPEYVEYQAKVKKFLPFLY